jgi:hypothetical protein
VYDRADAVQESLVWQLLGGQDAIGAATGGSVRQAGSAHNRALLCPAQCRGEHLRDSLRIGNRHAAEADVDGGRSLPEELLHAVRQRL